MKQQIVQVQINRCIGCHACELACRSEYDGSQYIGVAEWGPEELCGALKTFYIPIFSDPHSLCIQRMHAGINPVCINACPTGALQWIERKRRIKLIPEKGALYHT
jgi:Fe-S-cluster-containing dehydrogenase component